MQALPDGDVFLGWGELSNFSEDTASGKQDFDAHFTVPTASYRAYRFPWTGEPPGTPRRSPTSQARRRQINLYASWNGATGVTGWRVLGGAGPGTLKRLGTVAKGGFETHIAVHSNEPYFAVQALGPSSHRARHLHRLSHAAPSHDLRWLGVGAVERLWCRAGELRATAPCLVAATITAGRTVIAHTTTSTSRAGRRRGVLPAQRRGRSMLAHARGGRLPVQVKVHGSSGASAGATLDLVPFNATGAGPPRSLAQSSTLRIIGTDGFVSAGGVGSILARVRELHTLPCDTTLSIGSTVISRHRQRVHRRAASSVT